MNTELRQLAAAGAKVIQIEEPTIHFTAAFHPEETELLDFMVDAFNHEVEGLDDVELWIHTCWGNPNMQKVYSRRVVRELDRHVPQPAQGRRLDGRGDRERARRDRPVQALRRNLKKKVAVGVVSHRQLQADMAPVVAGRIRRALEVIPADKLSCRATAASAARASTGRSRSTRRPRSRRAATSCSRSWASSRVTCRPRTRRSRPTSCPTASR